MDTALSLASVSADIPTDVRNRYMQKARSQVAPPRSSVPFFPQLKLCNSMSDIDGVKKGEYFTVIEQKNDADEYEKAIDNIGKEPEIVILERRYSYSIYDQDLEKMIAWTNELDGFSQDHPVYVISNKDDGPRLLTRASFPQFKANKEALESELGGKFKFRNILYVYLPSKDKVFKMFVSNGSVTGIADTDKYGSYQNVQPGSFEDFKNYIVNASEPDQFFGTRCRLGSREHKKGFLLMTFNAVGPVKDIEAMFRLYVGLNEYLDEAFEANFRPLILGSMNQNVLDAEVVDELPDFES